MIGPMSQLQNETCTKHQASIFYLYKKGKMFTISILVIEIEGYTFLSSFKICFRDGPSPSQPKHFWI
uniref:Uncharacterized protein n=1 Tax=Rhizophora mucronata TaxID=61149 RepID=A0A2P2P9J6_RHIMU